jgi:hypothetical protein
MTENISFAFTPPVYALLAFGHYFPETGFNDPLVRFEPYLCQSQVYMGFALHLCQVMANDSHLFPSDDSHGSVLVDLESVPVYYYSHLHLHNISSGGNSAS